MRSLRQVARRGQFMRLEEGVDGRVAIGMEVQRNPHVIDLLDHLVDGILREGQFALPVLLARRSAGQVGRGEEGGPALRRAVDGDLDAADLETVVVLAPFGERQLGEDLVDVGDEGIGDDVDDVGPGVGGALHGLEVRKMRRALVGRGDAGLGIEHLAGLGGLDLLLRRHRLGLFQRLAGRRSP